MRILRPLAATLALVALAHPAAAQPDVLRDRFVARLQAASDRDDRTAAAYRPMWNVMDSIVLRELGRGGEVDPVNRVLAGLPGFNAASEGDGFSVGRGTFYSDLPRE